MSYKYWRKNVEILKRNITKKYEKMKIIHISYGVVTFCFLFIAMVLIACGSSDAVQSQSDVERLQVLELEYQLAHLTDSNTSGLTTSIQSLQSQMSTLTNNILALEKTSASLMQAGYAFIFLTAFTALGWAAHAITTGYMLKKKAIDTINNKGFEKSSDLFKKQANSELTSSATTDQRKSV